MRRRLVTTLTPTDRAYPLEEEGAEYEEEEEHDYDNSYPDHMDYGSGDIDSENDGSETSDDVVVHGDEESEVGVEADGGVSRYGEDYDDGIDSSLSVDGGPEPTEEQAQEMLEEYAREELLKDWEKERHSGSPSSEDVQEKLRELIAEGDYEGHEDTDDYYLNQHYD
ncbi:hypothetical protein B0H10DRAFT_2224342 [Mycena sp. CBHHK59/15]|nr:hypothetical protein B0H10DRAFT_2224342 [Mycena sp. CBHHK59/15]